MCGRWVSKTSVDSLPSLWKLVTSRIKTVYLLHTQLTPISETLQRGEVGV